MKPAANSRRERVRGMLADLKMPGALEAVDGILASADSGAATASEAIEELLKAQIELRNNRRLQSAMRSSRLPAVKTLADFDFAFQPSIKREQIESLHELGFLERAENVILLGPPGPGPWNTPRYVTDRPSSFWFGSTVRGPSSPELPTPGSSSCAPVSPRALPCTPGMPRSRHRRSGAAPSSC